MRLAVFILFCLSLAGCGAAGLKLRSSAASSGDPVILAKLEKARHRLLVALDRLQKDPLSVGRFVCNASLCHDAYSCQYLQQLRANGDQLDYVQRTYLSASEISKLQTAAENAEFHASTDPQELALDEVGQDAFTIGSRITVDRDRFQTKSDDAVLGVLGHELEHEMGRLDTGTAGPLADQRAGIDSTSSCLVALARGVEGESYQDQWQAVYAQAFASSSSLAAWNTSGQILVSASGYAQLSGLCFTNLTSYSSMKLKSVSAANVRVSMNVQSVDYCEARLVVRDNGQGSYYALSLSGYTAPTLSILKVTPAGATPISGGFSIPLPETLSRISLVADGAQLKAYYGDLLVLQATDTSLSAGGGVGIVSNSAMVGDFSVEKLVGLP